MDGNDQFKSKLGGSAAELENLCASWNARTVASSFSWNAGDLVLVALAARHPKSPMSSTPSRRKFLKSSVAFASVLTLGQRSSAAAAETTPAARPQAAGNSAAAQPLQIGAIVFPRMDQIDFTGPFEVLSQLPNSTFHIAWKEKTPVRDYHGLWLTPEKTFDEVPPLDLLIVPGGPGQEELMEDEAVLSFIRRQAAGAQCVFSVCTGALICGAAGLLKGKRATTHWGAFSLLGYFGATPVNERVVVDGKLVTAAGVTAGIDGALTVAARFRGDQVAQEIQLGIEYAPQPPFQSGTPDQAPAVVLKTVQGRIADLSARRLGTAQRLAKKLGS